MTNILITGSQGFIGPFLQNELTNYYLLTPTRTELDITSSFESYLAHHRPAIIFNLAAQSKPGLSFTAFEETFKINLFGTHNLLESVRSVPDYHPRIFLIGSAEEHGSVTDLPITETAPFNPQNPYGLSKLAAYYLSQQYVKNYGQDIVYLCPFTNLGPGQSEGFLVTDVCRQIVAIEQGTQPPILKVGNLTTHKDVTDVRDTARAMASLISQAKSGDRYNICSGVATPTQKIVDLLIRLAKVKIILDSDPTKFRPSETSILYGSNKKIHDLTGWCPTIPLEKTLTDCLNFIRQEFAPK